MGSSTSPIGLWKPTRGVGGSADDPVKVTLDVAQNMDLIDEHINLKLVPDGVFPTSPYIGQLVLEEPSLNIRMWDGSNWVLQGNDGIPKGRVASVVSTSDSANLAPADPETKYFQTTFTAKFDRRYWVEIGCHVSVDTLNTPAVTPCSGDLRVRWVAGATVANTDTQLGNNLTANVVQTDGYSGERFFAIYEFVPGINGTIAVGLFLKVNTGTTMFVHGSLTNLTRVNYLNVRDVGV